MVGDLVVLRPERPLGPDVAVPVKRQSLRAGEPDIGGIARPEGMHGRLDGDLVSKPPTIGALLQVRDQGRFETALPDPVST